MDFLYQRRAEVAGVKGPRVNRPKPNSPAAYVSYFYDELLPDWEEPLALSAQHNSWDKNDPKDAG